MNCQFYQALEWSTLACLGLLRITVPPCLHAQSSYSASLDKGAYAPSYPATSNFFLDTLTHRLYHYGQGRGWYTVVDSGALDACTCHWALLVADRNFGKAFSYAFASFPSLQRCEDDFCGYAILAIWTNGKSTLSSKNLIQVLDTHSKTIKRNGQWMTLPKVSHVPDTIAGIPAFCLPLVHLKLVETHSYETIHDWGFLVTNGLCLIEPKYDSPIRFRNGVAEVLNCGKSFESMNKESE